MSSQAWESLFTKFPHLGDQILDELDDIHWVTLRETSKPLKSFMDAGNLHWKRILNSYRLYKDYTPPQIAALAGQLEIFKALSIDVDDVNPTNEDDTYSPLHLGAFYVCRHTLEFVKTNDIRSIRLDRSRTTKYIDGLGTLAAKIQTMSAEGWPTWDPNYTNGVEFSYHDFFIILKKSHQYLHHKGSNFILSSLEVGH